MDFDDHILLIGYRGRERGVKDKLMVIVLSKMRLTYAYMLTQREKSWEGANQIKCEKSIRDPCGNIK